MLLRRINEHVKAQNWTAVGLDFIIVVVGVFIGIQVANWNDTLGEREREAQILQNIATDLRSDMESYALGIDSTLNKIAAITYIVERLPNFDSRNETDSITIGAWEYDDYIAASPELAEKSLADRALSLRKALWTTAILVSNAQPSATAFDSLVAAGELGILQNDDLVRRLQEYQFTTAALEKSQDITYRPRRDHAINTGQLFGLSAFGSVEEKYFLDLVAATPQLAATVDSQLGWAQGHFVMLSAAYENAKALLEIIEKELGEGTALTAKGADK